MAGIAFKDLALETPVNFTKVSINENIELDVRDNISIEDKTNMIKFIVDGALDEATGCFSPVRIEVYFGIAICRWYANITFDIDDVMHADKTYDALDRSGVIDKVVSVIPSDEFEFIQELVNSTIDDIARYNSSAAGIIRNMTVDADGLDSQIADILEKIQKGEGLEALSVIKDVVGTD